MVKRATVLLLVVALSGCAFQAGPIGFAFGDTEASRCHGDTVVEADGSYVCEGQHELARGSHIGDNLRAIFDTVFGGVFDLARDLVGGLGIGLASVGTSADSGDES